MPRSATTSGGRLAVESVTTTTGHGREASA